VDAARGHFVDGIVTHRCRDLVARHRTRRHGISVTTVGRTVLDLAAVVDEPRLRTLVDSLISDRRLTARRLFDDFDLVARRGRAGTAMMRQVLEPRLEASTVPRSELEAKGLAFLRRHGFELPLMEFRPPWAGPAVARVDAAYVGLQLVIEFDGRRWHESGRAFEHDRLRDQLAMSRGWIVIRITWRQLHDDPLGVANRLRATMAARAAISA